MAEPPSRCNPSGGPMGEGDRRVVRRTDRPMLSAHPWNAPCVKCLCPPWMTAPEKGARTKVHWGTEPNGAGWTWFICIAAVGLFLWGVAELIGVGGSGAEMARSGGVARSWGKDTDDPVIELHRLLPDATDDLGRSVTVDGAVVGEASRMGFWIPGTSVTTLFSWMPKAGPTPSRNRHRGPGGRPRGAFAPGEQADRLERAGWWSRPRRG